MSFDLKDAENKRVVLFQSLNKAMGLAIKPGDQQQNKYEEIYQQVQDALEEVEAALNDLGETLSIAPPTRFSNFLASAGEAMVQAQRDLDHQTRLYLEETKAQEYVQPSVFRIPKVSAEIKFALREIKGKGINLIFSSRKNDREESLNQSLQFEIVAAPPPVEVRQLLHSKAQAPLIQFVFAPDRRAALLKAIWDYEPIDQPGLTRDIEILKAAPVERILIWDVIEEAPGFIVLYADEDGESNVGLWHFNIVTGRLEALKRFGVEPKKQDGHPIESFLLLRNFVLEMSKKQAELLIGQPLSS